LLGTIFALTVILDASLILFLKHANDDSLRQLFYFSTGLNAIEVNYFTGVHLFDVIPEPSLLKMQPFLMGQEQMMRSLQVCSMLYA
jgi:hypothetical protein